MQDPHQDAHGSALCSLLRELKSALDAENNGHLQGAVSHYQQACAESASLLSLLQQQSGGGHHHAASSMPVLDGLLQTFTCRISMLLCTSYDAAESAVSDASAAAGDSVAVHAAMVQLPDLDAAAGQTQAGGPSGGLAAGRARQQSRAQDGVLPQVPRSCAAPPVGAAAAAAAAAPPPHAPPRALPPKCTPAVDGPLSELQRLCQRTPTGGLQDVIGMDDVKQELEEALLLPMQHPDLFAGIRRPPKTFLLHGSPGTGKTLVVEKVAAAMSMALLVLTPSTVLSRWHGESERSLRGLFDLARSLQPALVFIDEVDGLGSSRCAGDDAAGRRLLLELLMQMTSAEQDAGVFIFAATNRVQDCDEALLRRFERRIRVPLPDPEQRGGFIAELLARGEVASSLTAQQLLQLGRATSAFSRSDLTALCRQAALEPVRELLLLQQQRPRGCSPGDASGKRPRGPAAHTPLDAAALPPVTYEHFLGAMRRVAAAAQPVAPGGG